MEDEKIITLQLKVTRNHVLAMLAAFFLCWHPKPLGSETLTLTTYYPAPYGGYANLLTTGQTLMARDTGNVGIGTGTSLPGRKLDVRLTGSSTGRIVDIGNANGAYGSMSIGNNGARNYIGFNVSGSDNMVIDSLGNVGVGTTDPNPTWGASLYKLRVTGNSSTSGTTYAIGDVRIGYNTDTVPAGSNMGDLYVNGYFKNFCRRVTYTLGGTQSCYTGVPYKERLVGFLGNGCASRPGTCISGFLPASGTAWSSGTGKYITIGDDWEGVLICCKLDF